jgi:RNA-binding motif protein, X-linked 2
MNAIRQTALLNKRELEAAVPPSASWHADYRDTAYLYIGGLPLDISEGDIVTIFSQYGNPTHLNLIRDKETGKSKGFAFLKYEDQRSCDLAVDNLGGAEVLGRQLRVDHTRYKKRDGEDEDTWRIERLEGGEQANETGNGNGKRGSETDDSDQGRRKRRRRDRPILKEERELEEMLRIKEGEEEDPMREYLLKEKREEIERAKEREHKHKHRHRHRHRDRDEDGAEARHSHRRTSESRDAERRPRRRSGSRDGERKHRHRSGDDEREYKSSRRRHSPKR